MKKEITTRMWIVRVVTRYLKSIRNTYNTITEPLSTHEDDRRREYVLNTILILSVSALSVLGATVIWNTLHVPEYSGIHPLIFGVIYIAYCLLLYISKKKYWKIASILLVLFDAAGTLYTGWRWGASLPETLLLTVLVIETASILINSTVGFITGSVMIVSLMVLGIHESSSLHIPNWRFEEISVTDVITYSVMFLFISFIAWLSNREIDRSLDRARKSEKLLALERNTLEQRISERTGELIASQQKRLLELDHVVKIGELSQGIIHDMMSPLSSVALHIEELQVNPHKFNANETRSVIDKTITSVNRMKQFMESSRHLICPQSIHNDQITDIKKEITMVRDMLMYKARMAQVQIHVDTDDSLTLHVNPFRMHQILLNLISNAIDACKKDAQHETELFDNMKQFKEHIVMVQAKSSASHLYITVSDTGCGMSDEQIQNLFIHPQSTKRYGSGIGLINVHSIVNNELGGSINVSSTQKIGTTFIITIPFKQHGRNYPTHT